MRERSYYHAYDDRYRQIHAQKLQWFADSPSPIVDEVIQEFTISKQDRLLEIGCGEGRDAFVLLQQGFDLLATDISPVAISYCQNKIPDQKDHFQILDCVTQTLNRYFNFIFAVAVVHMLVLNEDRIRFYRFIQSHLTSDGIALICTMGDGNTEHQSDIRSAFDLQERIHEQTGKSVSVASTSCRMVSFQTFEKELFENGLKIVKNGMTAIEPDFPQMMYAVVRKV